MQLHYSLVSFLIANLYILEKTAAQKSREEEQIKIVVEEVKKQNIKEQSKLEDTVLRAVFNNIGAVGLHPSKPEISALHLNDSEFNFAEDSQMNDIIEVSNYAKPSEIGRFLDHNNNLNAEASLIQRFRKRSTLGDKNRESGKDDEELEVDQPIKVMNKPKLPDPFADLDTSGIAGDFDNNSFDKDFEPGEDHSFVGQLEENQNMFENKKEEFTKDKKQQSTPKIGHNQGEVSFEIYLQLIEPKSIYVP